MAIRDRNYLTTCWEPFTRKDGSVHLTKLWLFLPAYGERRFVGVVDEMPEPDAMALAARVAEQRGCGGYPVERLR
jgi:hypothetical protein